MNDEYPESTAVMDISPSDYKRPRITTNHEIMEPSSSSMMMDASTFLFKSPSNPCEIENFTTVLKDFLNSIIQKAFEDETTTATPPPTGSEPLLGYDTDEEKNQLHSLEQGLVKSTYHEIQTELDVSGSIVRGNPRSYQTALFELAKIQNTIVNLPTGSGKTLVALLCIKHFASDFDIINDSEDSTNTTPMEREDGNNTNPHPSSIDTPMHPKRSKQTLFLVPSIALAVQHTATLRANLPYKVATACNQLVRSTRARDELQKANIIVATHGAARNLFMHYGDMFSLKNMNLIVVDECHYAIGDHGYAGLFKNFYHTIEAVQDRPRIVGLTASPLVNVRKDTDDQKLEEMLQELESTLDAKLASISSRVQDRDGSSTEEEKGRPPSQERADQTHLTNQAIERVIHYHAHRAGKRYPHLPSFENIGLHPSRIKEFNLLYELYASLGPKVTAIYSKTLSFEVSKNSYDEESAEQFQLVRQHLLTIASFCEELCKKDPDAGRTEKLTILEEILEMEVEYNGTENSVGVVFVDRRITALALYNYFKEREKAMDQDLPWPRVADSRWSRRPKIRPSFNFVSGDQSPSDENIDMLNLDNFASSVTNDYLEQIDNSMIRQVVLGTLPDSINIQDLAAIQDDEPMESSTAQRFKTIRSDMLVRQSNQIFKYLDKRHHFTLEEEELLHEEWLHEMKKSAEVLDGLRSRRTNVLIATSVVEEGVDVEACSFVIVFDHLKSTKGYVQMRGRARQKNARFYVFHDTSPMSMTSYISLQDAFSIDRHLQHFIEQRPTNVPVPKPPPRKKIFEEFFSDEYKAVMEGSYCVGHGTVDLTSARSLLNRYSLGIPSELCTNSRESFMMKLPVFGENTLTLSSHLPGDVRHVDLPVEFHNCNKRDKMNMMALMACVRLHKLKLLNDRLLPIQRRDIQKTLIELTMSAMDVKISPLDTISLNTETSIEVFVYALEASGDSFDQFDKMLKGNGRKLCIVSTKEFPQTFLPMTFVHPELGPISYHLSHPTQTVVTPKEWSDLVSFYTFVMNARWTKRDGSTFFRFNIETLNGVVSPYLIGCLSKDGSIDWPRMAKNVRGSCRSIIDRIEAVRNYSESELKEPRICCTIYDHFAFYIIFGGSNLTSSAAFPHNERGFETYYQYMTEARNFEVDQNGRLFHGQRLWYLPRRPLHEFSDETSFEEYEQENVDKSLDVKSSGGTVMLPQDAIMEATFADSSLYLHLIILPQFLFYLDHNLSAHAFLDYTSKNLPILGQYLQQISDVSLDPIKEAITARSCGLGSNYDKLEWLGDAVLKLIHTDALLSSSVLRDWVKYLHEGDLSMLRGALGSNETLAKAAKNTNIDKFIYAKQLGRVQWSPNCLELMTYEEDGTVKSLRDCEIIIGKKTCADVVESLMGLIYMHFGYEAANDVAFELGISILKGERVDKSIPGYVANKRLLTMAKSALNMNTFKRPELIEEALTHPSCLHEQVPSYQNLEWIGDAVLCLFARHWIFQQFPHLHVSAMNLLEASLICNETLAYVCLSQGIHRFMNHRDPALPSRIEEVERALSSNGRGLWTTDPPKCISDVVESLLGACHMDAGFEVGQSAAKHMLSPVLEALASRDIGDDTAAVKQRMMHPKQSLHETANFIQIKALTEEAFAHNNVNCPIWRDHYWGTTVREGTGYLAVISAFGVNLAAIHDASAHVARNRACAICHQVLDQHLRPLLQKVQLIVYKRVPENKEEAFTSRVY